jgi:phage gp36-like protein
MAYLALNDYTLRTSLENLNEILAQAAQDSSLTVDNVRSNAESWAQAMIKSYLSAKYNITAEFALSSPTARNFIIMQIMIDLVLCTVHKTINPRDIPDHIAAACEEAMEYLAKVRDGELIIDLPLPPVNPTDPINLQSSYIGSQIKFISKPYQDSSITGNNNNNPYAILP